VKGGSDSEPNAGKVVQHRKANPYKQKLGRFVGLVLLYGAGLLMFIFWVGAMGRWLGTLGIILAIVISPGAVVFPIAY
jgi:hypothetical protein